MKPFAKILSAVGLALTALPAFLVLTGHLAVDTYQHLMLSGTLLWMLSAPVWMFHSNPTAKN